MTPKLDIPITLELAQSAYPQYDWTLGYRVSDDYLTVTRVPMFSAGLNRGVLEWWHVRYGGDRYRWMLEIVFRDRLCYLTREEMSSELQQLGHGVRAQEVHLGIAEGPKSHRLTGRCGRVDLWY